MTGSDGFHNVQIVGATQVPYHYRLIATQRGLAGADLLSNKDGVAETQLPAGSFLCYAEDLTTGAISTTTIKIATGGPDLVVVELGERPRATSAGSNFRPSRVEAYQSFRTASALSGEIDEDLGQAFPGSSLTSGLACYRSFPERGHGHGRNSTR